MLRDIDAEDIESSTCQVLPQTQPNNDKGTELTTCDGALARIDPGEGDRGLSSSSSVSPSPNVIVTESRTTTSISITSNSYDSESAQTNHEVTNIPSQQGNLTQLLHKACDTKFPSSDDSTEQTPNNGIIQTCQKPDLPGKKKKSNPSANKLTKRDDTNEQLAHAKSVIYNLEKMVEDERSSNRILAQELSLLKRMHTNQPQSRVDVSLSQNSNPSHDLYNIQHKQHEQYPVQGDRISSSSSFAEMYRMHSPDSELRMLRDRLNMMEIEQLKCRMSQLEQMNYRLSHASTMMN